MNNLGINTILKLSHSQFFGHIAKKRDIGSKFLNCILEEQMEITFYRNEQNGKIQAERTETLPDFCFT